MPRASRPQGPGHHPGGSCARQKSCVRVLPLAVSGPRCRRPPPPRLYAALYGARGHGDNERKAVKHTLRSDRTSATSFRANAMRLVLACAA
jgi:hypothetical protein